MRVDPLTPMTHTELVKRCQRWLRITRRHPIVLVEAATAVTNEQPDVIGWRNGWVSALIECKASRSDFLRDRAKWFRRAPDLGMGRERWYAAPPGIIAVDDIPERWGLLEVGAKVAIVREPVAFEEWAWRTEMALVHTALRRATEGWGQKIFGDLAQTDAPHPSASKRLIEAAKENSRLRDEVRNLRRQLGEATRGREVA